MKKIFSYFSVIARSPQATEAISPVVNQGIASSSRTAGLLAMTNLLLYLATFWNVMSIIV